MERIKRVRTEDYNYDFDRESGLFVRWGRDVNDDPPFSPLGPEILDIEVSTICHGPAQNRSYVYRPCDQCYKSNTPKGKHMSVETFRTILNKIPDNLTQIAFGIGDIDASRPYLYDMFASCRSRGVVPNLTINGSRMSDNDYKDIRKFCGAVAVSDYGSQSRLTAGRLISDGMQQVNIHKMLCEETYGECMSLINLVSSDPDLLLSRINAIVFLLMKPKGNRNKYTQLRSMEKYKALIARAMEKNVRIGFDSCSAPYFLDAVKDSKNYKLLETLAEPCESDLFSAYINVEGKLFHCSFTEGEEGWEGVDMLDPSITKDNFLEKVWRHPEVERFRHLLTSQKGCRECPIFDLKIK